MRSPLTSACPDHFDHLVKHVTEELCKAAFATRQPKRVKRYLLPNLSAMNFVLEEVLDGGVNKSLHLDRHGKTLSYLLLDQLIEAPSDG